MKHFTILAMLGVILSSISIGQEEVYIPFAGSDRKTVEYQELSKEEQAAYKIFEYSILRKNGYILQYIVSDSIEDVNNLKNQVMKEYNANFQRCLKKEYDTYLLIEKSSSTGKFSIEMPISGGGGVALRVVFKKVGQVFKITEWANPD